MGDGFTNDYASVQAAIDTACTSGATHSTVFFPTGHYNCLTPLRLYKSNVTLVGESRIASLVSGMSPFGGPVLSVAAQVGTGFGLYPTIPTGPALVGSGVCYKPSGTEGIEGFEFRDFGTATNVNGLSAFAVEFWFNADPSTVLPSTLMSCGGSYDQGLSHNLLNVNLNNATQIGVNIDINGTVVPLFGTYSLGATHHMALTYDGSTARLFIDGSLQASAGATGGLVQKFHENWQIGYGAVSQWPVGNTDTFPTKGSIDSIRISNVARYTSGFTPPASKLTADGNTLALQNWDGIFDMFALGSGTNGPCYMVYHRPTGGAETSAGLANVEIKELSFYGTVFMTNTVQSRINTVYVDNTLWGLWLDNNCYLSSIRNLGVLGSAYTMAGLILGPANGLMELTDIQLESGNSMLVAIASSGVITNLWLELNSNNVCNVALSGPGHGTS